MMERYGTLALLRFLPGLLQTSRGAARVSGVGAIGVGWSIADGWSEVQSYKAAILNEVDARVAQAQAALDEAARTAGQYSPAAVAANTKAKLEDSARGLWNSYYAALQTGAGAAADNIKAIAQRVWDAAAKAPQSLHDAFAAFWGFDPGDVVQFGALAALLLVVLGGGSMLYLYSTPAGQSYIASVGSGFGKGIAGVGNSLPGIAGAVVKAL